MKAQVELQEAQDTVVVPKRSYFNSMNPLYCFPCGGAGRDLMELFASATVLEAMLVAKRVAGRLWRVHRC